MPTLPDLSALPFASGQDDWFVLVRTETAEEAVEMLKDDAAPRPGSTACLHLRAVADFAARAGVGEGEAKVAMGQGVFRWWDRAHPSWEPADGSMFRAELGGAKDGSYAILRRGGHLLMCLADDVPGLAQAALGAQGPPAVAKGVRQEHPAGEDGP
jgi:hypothetical protein